MAITSISSIIYFDALMIKVKEDRRVINKAFYLALGVNLDGQKELLNRWISKNEGSKFWLNILTELKSRGLEDILIACVDGLTGFLMGPVEKSKKIVKKKRFIKNKKIFLATSCLKFNENESRKVSDSHHRHTNSW